jgi:hypothetical protein
MTIPHVMIDLETLSTAPNAMILSLGAVAFDADGIHNTFYSAIKTQPLETLVPGTLQGAHVSCETLKWWQGQSDKAKEVFTDPRAEPLDEVLRAFILFCEDFAPAKDIRMWGNGSDFDNVILASAYRRTGLTPPWRFYHNRCYRTVKNMFPSITMERRGTHHNALDDAQSQAEHLFRIGVFFG